METDPVSTIVLHDSMGNTEIGRCADPGCYSRSIMYGATVKQMVALMEQSKSCEQQMRYDCFTTALTTADTHYSWWVDRHGQPQYYWDGSHAGEHVCNCGLTSDCIDPIMMCNCDAKAPQWESDAGIITNRTALPIIELRLGGLRFKGQKANYTLGGLVCRAKVPPPNNPAESCSSLRRAGNDHPGYYLINSKKGRLDVVMCRMDLEETDPEFQVETSARIAWGGFTHGKVTPPDNPAHSCSSLRRAGNAYPGYYLISPKKGRLDVVMCRMDLEETDSEFQVETGVRLAGGVYFNAFHSLGSAGSVLHFKETAVNSMCRKIQELGLTQLYREDDDFAIKIRMMTCLAFVPVEDVQKVFAELEATMPSEAKPVVQYFRETYVDGRRRRGRARNEVVYPPQLWNVRDRTLSELKVELSVTEHVILKLGAGNIPGKKKAEIDKNNRILAITRTYGDRCNMSFLRGFVTVAKVTPPPPTPRITGDRQWKADIGPRLYPPSRLLDKATRKLSTDYENMKKEHEQLKSSFQEHLQERYKLELQLNTTEKRLQCLEAISLQIAPRTCQTLADLGVTRTGEYLVDPDVVLIGDAPIKVLCDMETGRTTVSRRLSLLETYTMPGRWTVTANLSTIRTGQTQDNTYASAVPLATASSPTCLAIVMQKPHDGNQTQGRGKTPPRENPTESCSSLRQAGNTHSGYYLINPKKGRLDVAMCWMDLEESDPKFQVETSATIAWGGFTHGKVTPPNNPAQSCSSLRRAAQQSRNVQGEVDIVSLVSARVVQTYTCTLLMQMSGFSVQYSK
ncbi:unnamed protein product [Darwinula stevensoni]|uniref:Uncharacterized protein n=1 Tax=Darwinula stevensoni TaxID=69355 RepID=A0A7R8XLS3_9CRUS|nr:unnamed protein product [Darwinula stevensoni]CAG0894611.1 unnamed protein product [Darwinula stevensoni]